MKLSRITLDSLKNLEQDPQAVEKALDAYQGSIRGDRSVGNNLRRQAESVENLRRVITSTVPKAIGELSDIGQQEAQEEWLNGSESQKKIWRDAVKNGDVGPWHSPFFNIGMERMVAAEHIEKYQASWSENLQKARLSKEPEFLDENGRFDFQKWSAEHLSEYTATNGLANIRPKNYTIFAKGISQIHARSNAQLAEARGAQVVGDYKIAFGSTLRSIHRDGTLTLAQKGHQIDQLVLERVTNVGFTLKERKEFWGMVQSEAESLYKESVLSGVGDPDKFLEIVGNTHTGSNVLFKDTTGYTQWKETVAAKADALVIEKDQRVAYKRQKADIELFRGLQDFLKDKSESMTNVQALTGPGGEQFLAQAKAWEGDPTKERKDFVDFVNGIKSGALDNDTYRERMPDLLSGTKDEGREKLMSLNPTQAMLNTFDATYDSMVEIKTGSNEVFLATKEKWTAKQGTTMAMPFASDAALLLGVPKDVRVGWFVEAERNRNREIAALAHDNTKSKEEKQKAVVAIDARVESFMNDKFKDFNAVKTAKEEVQTAKTKVATATDTWVKRNKNHAKGLSEGNGHDIEYRKILDKIKARQAAGRGFGDLVSQAQDQLLKSERYKTTAEIHDIPLRKENLDQLNPLVKQLMGTIKGSIPPLSAAQQTKAQKKADSRIQTTVANIAEGALNSVMSTANATTTQSQRGHKSHSNTATIASQYNAGPPEEQAGYIANIEEREAALMQGKEPEGALEHISEMKDVINVLGVKAFDTEIAENGYEVLDIVNDMREIYAGETYYGTSKSKRSKTGALGEMQVLPSTFKDLVDRGVLGPKFASALGMTTEELHAVTNSKDSIEDFLLNNKKGNYLAAMGKWINMKKAAKGA